MKITAEFDAVIFDLDGTLIDSAPDLHAAVNRMLADMNAGPLSLTQVRSFIGNGVPKLVERALSASGIVMDGTGLVGAVDRFKAIYEADPVALTRPYPGVTQALATLREAGLPLGICTNKHEAATRLVLDGLDLGGYFGAVIGGDTLSVTKPDPAPFFLAAERLGYAGGRLLFIGDSETDAATAKAAGVPFALFANGYRKSPIEEFEAIHVFEGYEDFLECDVWKTGR